VRTSESESLKKKEGAGGGYDPRGEEEVQVVVIFSEAGSADVPTMSG